MPRRKSLSVVIPSYNDREIIRPFYDAIVQILSDQDEFDWQLIIVDDGSHDGSQVLLREIAEGDPRVTYIELAKNAGQQIAVFVGLKHSSGDYVVSIDGDFQYDPSAILILARELEKGFDLVSGVRERRQESPLHAVSSRLGNVFLRRAVGIGIRDFGAIKGFRRNLVDAIVQTENFYMNVYTVALTFTDRVTEVEVRHLPRYAGSSKWTMWQRLFMLMDVYFTAARHEFAGALQILVLLLGIALAAGAVALAAFLISGARNALAISAIALGLVLYLGVVVLLLVVLIFAIRIFRMNVRSRAYLISATVRKTQKAQLVGSDTTGS